MKKSLLLLVGMLSVCSVFAQDIVSHVIQRGETLESIAAKCGTTQATIKELNPLVDIYCAGMEIVLPVKKQKVNIEKSTGTSISKKEKGISRFMRALGDAIGTSFGTGGFTTMQYNNMYMSAPSFEPYYNPSMSMSQDWGSGYAGPMMYSNDPVLNATIGVAMSEQKMMNEGIIIPREPIKTEKYHPTTLKDAGWYSIPEAPSFGLPRPYAICPNCGSSYQKGSGHLCRIK